LTVYISFINNLFWVTEIKSITDDKKE